MNGPHVIPYLPGYIPPDVDMDQINADVADDGVAVPPAAAADVPALREVVEQAGQEGIDLKIVIIEHNPPIDTPLRDIATEVGQAHPGSTVLVLSPSESGTYSPTIDRVTLEAGQDVAEGRGPVQGAKNFLGELTTEHFPWTAFTLLLVLGVVAAVIATRMLQVRSKRVLSRD
ncbi:Rv1476 family membrane protein [Mycolicibacterium sp. XJ879]